MRDFLVGLMTMTTAAASINDNLDTVGKLLFIISTLVTLALGIRALRKK